MPNYLFFSCHAVFPSPFSFISLYCLFFWSDPNVLFVLSSLFFRHRGPPAPWGSGSQNCLSGTGSSRLGSLKGGPIASGWQASSTRRASWQQWDRYTWRRATYLLTRRQGGDQMACQGTSRHMATFTHASIHADTDIQAGTRTCASLFSNELQFMMMWKKWVLQRHVIWMFKHESYNTYFTREFTVWAKSVFCKSPPRSLWSRISKVFNNNHWWPWMKTMTWKTPLESAVTFSLIALE